MNEKITLPTLVQLLAIASGDTKKQSEDFIKEFFSLISRALSDGEQVKIKDFGVFKTIVVDARESVNVSSGERHLIPAHRKVVFVPSKEMAASVNSPFDMFETVEIETDIPVDVDENIVPEDVTDDDSLNHNSPKQEELSVPVVEETAPELTEEPIEESNEELEDSSIDEVVELSAGEPEESTVEQTQSIEGLALSTDESEMTWKDAAEERLEDGTPHDSNGVVPEEYEEEYGEENEEFTSNRKSRFGVGFLWGFLVAAIICCIAFVAAFYFGFLKIPGFDSQRVTASSSVNGNTERKDSVEAFVQNSIVDSANSVDQNSNELNDKIEERQEANGARNVPTEPSDKRVFDTISRTRYLTTMAKQHYGNFHLWPYIYIENRDFLGHPDRIRPGTKVVIPPLSKYGVNPNNPADIEKAKKLGVEIYSKYN